VLYEYRPGGVAESAVVCVDDRRHEPFIQRRIGLQQKPQRLAHVPARKVDEAIVQRAFDDVAALREAEVPRRLVRVDEAHVIVAVGRAETPGAAAGLRGIENANAVRARDIRQRCGDVLANVGANVVVARCNRHQGHVIFCM
jgi:hypothetical protein